MPESTKDVLVIAITEEDIQQVKDGQMVLEENEKIAIHRRGTDENHQVPSNYFVIRMSERALNRVQNSQTVTYGIRQLNGVNQELFVRKGRISERLGTDKTTKEQLMDDGMSEEEAERYS